MVNLSRRFKLEYQDAVDGTTVIAETGQNTGAPKIDRHVHIRRTNDADILKLWIEEPDFGNTIPTDRTNFANAQNGENEPEILYKQYDEDANAFVTQGRFYAKNAGSINEEGQLAVKLYSFMRYTAKQDVNASSTVDLEDAMNQVLPPGYVADTPASTPNVDNYSVSSRREKGYHELTRNYAFALTFTAELDVNNDYKVKFEPVGFGGSVDTLVDRGQGGRYPIISVDTTNDIFVVQGDKTTDLVVGQAILVDGSTGNDGTYEITSLNYDATNNETDITVSQNVTNATADGSILPGGTAKFKSWEKDKTDSVVNKVVVEGTNANGVRVTGTADNIATQDKVGVKKKGPIKVGYLASSAEGDEIAKSYLVPGKDSNGNNIQELPESGRIKTTVYSDNVVNDSFQVVSNRLNIDDTYTCAQQRNFWPEGATEIDFEFEQEGLEEAARDTENLRDERARLLPSNQTDVGNQSVDADTENVNDSYDDFGNDNHPHSNSDSTSNANSLQFETAQTGTAFSETLSDGQSKSVTASATYSGNAFQIIYELETDAGYGAEFIVQISIGGFVSESYVTKTNNGGDIDGRFSGLDDISGDTVEFLVVNKSGGSVTVTPEVTVQGEATHDHDVPIGDTFNNTTGGNNNTNTSDSSAGDTTSLNASGSTESNVNVNTTTEDKTDR